MANGPVVILFRTSFVGLLFALLSFGYATPLSELQMPSDASEAESGLDDILEFRPPRFLENLVDLESSNKEMQKMTEMYKVPKSSIYLPNGYRQMKIGLNNGIPRKASLSGASAFPESMLKSNSNSRLVRGRMEKFAKNLGAQLRLVLQAYKKEQRDEQLQRQNMGATKQLFFPLIQ